MDTNLRGILIGMSLGDGYIDNRIPTRATLRVEHGKDQAEYAQHKLDRLKSLIGGRGELRFRERLDKRTGKTYSSCMFVVGDPKFITIYKYVYHEGKKQYQKETLEMLTPEGICYWYLDDGYAKQVFSKRTGKVSSAFSMLYTYCSEQEADIIIQYFSNTWKINPTKCLMYKDKWALKFNTSESKKLVALIIDFVPDSMIHKISHVSEQLFHECLQSEVKCEVCGFSTRNKRFALCQSCVQIPEGQAIRQRKLQAMI